MEPAAGGQVDGIRHQALDGLQPVGVHVQPGDGPEQADGVGVGGVIEDILQRAVFHDLAGVHDGHLVAALRHDAQVMGDEHHRRAEFLFQLVYHPHHLGLDGHVQGGGGLVGQQQLGVAGQGSGDNHPLLHAAGELMGIVPCPVGADAHLGQNVHHALLGLGLGAVLVPENDLRHLVPHSHDRVQGGHGVLEDHGDLVAPDVLDLLLLHGENVLSLIDDAAILDLSRLRHQPENAQGGGGFARAGLAHQAQGLAFLHGETDAVDGPHIPLLGREVDGQVLDFK